MIASDSGIGCRPNILQGRMIATHYLQTCALDPVPTRHSVIQNLRFIEQETHVWQTRLRGRITLILRTSADVRNRSQNRAGIQDPRCVTRQFVSYLH